MPQLNTGNSPESLPGCAVEGHSQVEVQEAEPVPAGAVQRVGQVQPLGHLGRGVQEGQGEGRGGAEQQHPDTAPGADLWTGPGVKWAQMSILMSCIAQVPT